MGACTVRVLQVSEVLDRIQDDPLLTKSLQAEQRLFAAGGGGKAHKWREEESGKRRRRAE